MKTAKEKLMLFKIKNNIEKMNNNSLYLLKEERARIL